MTSKVLSEEVLGRMETTVLYWLATVSKDGMPHVSPKEAFMQIAKLHSM
jgi:predicted pyridoxine 5'-phosphate oxidase superfamily flavin-nucleotide-binding protein